jgi:hypothetical protein
VAFDPVFARDVALQLAAAAYNVMNHLPPGLPPGFVQTSLIEADPTRLAVTSPQYPSVAAMAKDTNVFGLMGHNPATRTAFISFRGSSDLSDWLADFDALPTAYLPLTGFGEVATGFQIVYQTVRNSVVTNLAAAVAGCDNILITGHSLGAAVAVLAAPDVFRNMPPNTIEPRLITFAGPQVGLTAFATAFNQLIESCFRVVNYLDIVPLVPPVPYVPVGAQVEIDSGGAIDWAHRHSLGAYRDGLTALIGSGPPGGGSV